MSSTQPSIDGPLTHFYRRLSEYRSHRQSSAPRPITIVALGDSVTAGAGPGDSIYVDEVYHARLRQMLENRYPDCEFQVINSGIGGETAVGGLEGFEARVASHRPDLLLIAYGLNDCATTGRDGLGSYRSTIEQLIDQARRCAPTSIILVTPNMMPWHATGLVPERWKQLTEPFIRLQREGVLAAYAGCLIETARERNVAVADVYSAWQELHEGGVDTTAMLVNGLNHPDESGHLLAAKAIMQVIEDGEKAA